MKWTLQIIITIISWCMLSAAYPATPISLTNVRVKATSATAQVILQFSKEADYDGFLLHNPERYVIDLYEVKLLADLPTAGLPVPLEAIRASADKDKLRLVMDLEHGVTPRLVKLPSAKKQGYALSIEFPRQFMKATQPKTGKVSSMIPKMSERIAELPKPVAIADDLLGGEVEKVSTFVASNRALTDDSLKTPKAKKWGVVVNRDLPQPSDVKPSKSRDVVIVIDPGHGGKDPGAKGSHGTQEKEVVLAIAKRLQAHINKQPGFRAVLTRTGDYYIGLRTRLDIARKYQGDMFIAIHADAHEHLTACGVGVYALSQRGATSEAARWLAKHENASEFVGGLDLADKDQVLRSVLIDLSQTQSITASLQMGAALLHHLGEFADLHHPHVEQAAFVVLKSPDIPSLLIETGFISNFQEERRLRSPQYQDRIAQALLLGIKNYFVHNPPRGSSLAHMSKRDLNV
jgi:N-acetylmuramoyl-L-alanine amidase